MRTEGLSVCDDYLHHHTPEQREVSKSERGKYIS